MLYATYILGAFSSIRRSFTDMRAPKVSRDFGFGRFGAREISEQNSGLHLWTGLAQLSMSVPTETNGYIFKLSILHHADTWFLRLLVGLEKLRVVLVLHSCNAHKLLSCMKSDVEIIHSVVH